MLFAFADYIATLDGPTRDEALSIMISQKDSLYARAHESPDAAAVLLHLHLLLAEGLAQTRPGKRVRMSQYHVTRAFEFWQAQPRTEAFKDLLSPRLRDSICSFDTCQQSCASNRWRPCLRTCEGFIPKLVQVCAL
jgi:hypothetical protein